MTHQEMSPEKWEKLIQDKKEKENRKKTNIEEKRQNMRKEKDKHKNCARRNQWSCVDH